MVVSSVASPSPLLGACALAIVSACAGEPTAAQNDFTVRDSAGIEVVEWRSRPEGPLVRPEPVWVVGDEAGDYTFQRVAYGVLREDGAAVVVDAGNVELVVVAPSAPAATVLLRGGRGPGEFGAAYGLAAPGADTVWLQDRRNGRYLRLVGDSVDGEWTVRDRESLARGLRIRGLDDAGRLLLSTASFDPRFREDWLEASLVRFDVEAGAADTVGTFDMVPRISETDQNPFAPFGDASVAGGRWFATRSDRPEVRFLGDDAVPVRVVRWTGAPRMPTQADLDAQRETRIARFQDMNGASRERAEAFFRERDQQVTPRWDEALPWFGEIHGDDRGHAWLAEYRPDYSSPSRYSVVSPDGRSWHTVEFPRPVEILDIRDGHVLATVTDDFDVQAVALFALESPGDPGGG